MSCIDLATADKMNISSEAVISKEALDVMTKLTSQWPICNISEFFLCNVHK